MDIFHFEHYQVVSGDSGYGFSSYGEKKLHPKFSLGGGYAQHDRPGLYSDRFATGKRIFLNVHLALNSEFSLSTFVTQAIVNQQRTAPGTRVDVVFGYNLLHSLRRTGLF